MQDSSDDEGSRSGSGSEDEGSKSSSSTRTSRSTRSSSSTASGSAKGSASSASDASDDETEDEAPSTKATTKKPAVKTPTAQRKSSGSATGSVTKGRKISVAGLKRQGSGGNLSSPAASERSAAATGKKSKFLGGPKKAEPAVKKRPAAKEGEADGPQRKKAKPAPDKAKPTAAKKSPGVAGKAKTPGAGGAQRPAAAKKEKGTPRPAAKKAPVAEGQPGDEVKEEKTPKARAKKEPGPKKPPAVKKAPAKKKRLITWEEEKELKKNLKVEIKKRQTDAKARVTQYFKRESKITPFAHNGGRGGGRGRGLSTVPPPAPSSSIMKDLSPDQGSRLVNSWNFLYTFARPLGLVTVPSLPELVKALRVLELGAGDEDEKYEAERLWQEVCVTLVRAVAPEVEALVGLRGSSNTANIQDLFSRKTGLLLPFNCLTWPEIARLCLLVSIYRELSFTDAHIHECLRGRFNFRKNKAFIKLLKLRMEGKKLRPKSESSPDGKDPAALEPPSSDAMAVEAVPEERLVTSDGGPAMKEHMVTPKQPPSVPMDHKPDHAARMDGAAPMDVAEPSDSAVATALFQNKEAAAAKPAASDVPASLPNGSASVHADQDKDASGAEKMEVDEEPAEGERKARARDDDDDEEGSEDEEDEGLAEVEVAKELEEVLASPDRSENEKRMAYVLKRLLAHSCSESVGVDGTQSLEVASSLIDYPMGVWQPVRVATLVAMLRDGDFSGEDGTELLARHANLMCFNSFATNIEDSEPWGAADRFSAIFDRLINKWILDPARPPLDSLREEPCNLCGKALDKLSVKVTCSRCSALMHPYCVPASQKEAASEEGWCCVDCVSLSVRKQWYSQVRAEPEASDVSDLMYDSLPDGFKRVVDLAKIHVGDWGAGASFPALLDLSINRTVFQMAEEDAELANLIYAVGILASRNVQDMEQRLILLDALCSLAASAPCVRSFLDDQEHRIGALRRKMPEDEAVLRNELKAIGGDAAVLAWKDPVTEVKEHDAGAEEDEEQGVTGVCCVCEKSTVEETDDSKVILCEDCPTEIHLTCLDPTLTEVPKADWFCARCKAKRNQKRKAKAPPRPEEMEDPLEKEREDVENQLFTALVEQRAQLIFEARQAGEGAAPPPPPPPPTEVCEYCGLGELETCSPLVLGQSREETEQHIKMLASAEARQGLVEEDDKNPGKRKKRKRALEEGEPLPPLVPYFPRTNSPNRSKMPSNVHYPIVHERCAIQILGLRAHNLREREEGKGDRDERLIDDALRISGTRTFPLGEDRHGRCYWRMPGDDERLFVWIRDVEEQPDGLPGKSSSGHWLCYETKEDIEALVHYLNERDPGERALKAMVIEAFLGERRPKIPYYDESLVIRKPAEVSEDEKADKMEVDEEGNVVPAAGDAQAANTSSEASAPSPPPQPKDESTESELDGGTQNPDGAGASSGPVALKLIEAKCQIELPPEFAEIEIPSDMWGEEYELGAAIRKSRKYYALALVDAKDNVWEERAVSVKYEVFRGGDVLETSTAVRAHKDFHFWFYAYEFKLPGIYTLRFSVVTDPFSRSIKPFCVRITVRGRRSLNDYGEALNALSFLNLTRGGRQTHRHQNELNVEDAADDLAALRVALHELKAALPPGALVTSEEDLVGVGGNGSASKSGSAVSKGSQFIWTEACEAQWTNHLMEATGPQQVMEALIVLEHCLHPDWLKPWYGSLRKAYASSHAHLLRSPTVGAVALHLFVLDKAIMYDKEKVVPRNMRSQGRSSGQGRPGRKSLSRTSYADASDDEEYEEEEEEEESESEEEDDGDDEDYGARRSRSSRRSKPKKPSAPQRPRRSARDRTVKTYLNDDDEDDDEEEEAELSEEGPRVRPATRVDQYQYELAPDKEEVANSPGKWSCVKCTMINERISSRCRICGTGRNHKPSPPRTSAAQETASPEKQHDAAGASADAARSAAGGADGSDAEDGGEDPTFVKNCKTLVKKLWAHNNGTPFRYDVTDEIAPGYTAMIARPMSLKTLIRKVKTGKYKASYTAFCHDANLMFKNAEQYNGPTHEITRMARELRDLVKSWAEQHQAVLSD